MTIWGAWDYGTSNGAKIGVDWAYTSGNILTAYVSATTEYNRSGDVFDMAWSGGMGAGSQSSAGTFTAPSGGTVTNIWSLTFGAQPYNSTATITLTMSALYDGGADTPTVTFGAVLGPLPPAAPTIGAAAYGSDSQATVAWTDNPTSTAPYDSLTVLRRTGGTTTDTIINSLLAGTAASYTDPTLAVDRYYAYSIRAVNSAGTATSGLTAWVYTSPAAPSGCSAVRSGSDIAISWTNNSSYATTFEVWRSDNGGAYALIATVTGTTYTDPAPNTSQTHQYQVRAKSPANPGGGFVYSGYSTSLVVILLARPNPPTSLAFTAPVQAGAVIDATGATTLAWVPNPVDSSAQSAYEVNYQVSSDGGATWTTAVTTGKITSTTSARTVTASTWANGKQVRWQVRTWGAYAGTAPTYSDWSAWSTIYTSARPIATNTTPTTCATSHITGTGAYFDAEGTTQAGARWSLRTTGGVTLETVTLAAGSPDLLTHPFAMSVADATSYVVAYAVQDGSGLWSVEDTQTVAVSYALPPAPSVALTFSSATGAVSGTITNPVPGGTEVDTVSNSVYRDGLLILTGIAPNGSWSDPIPPLAATVAYTVEAVSATPSMASVDATVSTTGGLGMVWLNAGPGFSLSAAVSAGPVAATDESRVRAWRQYAGRTAPQMYDGEVLAWGVKLSGYADPDEYTALSTVVNAQGVACYRDPDGRRVFVGLGSLSHTRGTGIATAMPFSLPMTQTDFSE